MSILALSIVLGIGTSLASWAGVSTSLAPVYDLATGAWEWAQVHVFTVTVSGIVVSILGLGTPFLLKRIDRRDSASQQRKARDRQVMLARVIHRCTTGIIEGPDSQKVWFELGIRRLYNPDRELAELRPATSSPALTGVSLTSIFDNAGGGILILGAPGAGKTTALLTITRDLVKRAETDQTQPIPVVLSLSSWATRRLPLSEWLVDELATAYNVPRSIGRQWLASHEFLPLLDGLDEVATPLQASCVRSINDFRRTHGLLRFVISSRKDEHASAWKLLQVEDVLEILPPTRQEIADYLAGAGPAFADVAAAAAADPTLWELLRSPLVMNVIFSIYRDKPATALRSPGSQEHRLALLFESYTKRMIERRASQFSAVHSARWLTWLARSMYERNESAFHLDRLRPDWLPGRFLQKLATWAPASLIGIIAAVAGSLGLQDADGLLFGLFFLLVFAPRRLARDGPQRRRIWQRAGLRVGVVLAFCIGIVPGIAEGDIADGLVEGLFFGLFGALLFELRREEPTEELGWMWWRALRGTGVGLACGLLSASAYALSSPQLTQIDGVLLGMFFAVAFGMAYGIAPRLARERAVPNDGIHRSARYSLAIGGFFGLMFALPFGLFFGPTEALVFEVFFATCGTLTFGGFACLQHLSVRILLACKGLAPLRYVRFLDDAAHHMLLHRVGSGYIFIHRLLLEHLAGVSRA